MQIAESIGSKLLVAKAGLALGVCDGEEGDLEAAERRFSKSRDLFHDLGYRLQEAQCIANLALIRGHLGRPDQQIELYEQATAIFEQIGCVEGLAISHLHLGELYFDAGDIEQARTYFEKMAALTERSGQTHRLCRAYAKLAELYLTAGNIEEALTYAEKSQALSRNLEQTPGAGTCYRILGEVYLASEDFASAKALFEQSISLLEGTHKKEDLEKAMTGLQAVNAQIGK